MTTKEKQKLLIEAVDHCTTIEAVRSAIIRRLFTISKIVKEGR